MKWCQNCVLPDSRPGIVIGSDGICNACKNSIRKKYEIDWSSREKAFSNLIEDIKSQARRFDCLIPVSGGKDSTWQVVKCLKYGLRPLAVTWKTPARTKIGQRNLDNLVRLGVDHIDWQVNPEIEKKFLLKALERFGATAIPMHMALFNIPLNIAVKFNIPLVVWGENSAFEYGTADEELTGVRLDSKWLQQFGVTHGTTAKDWIDHDLSEKDMSSYFGPTDEEMDQHDVKAVFLGYYFKWDVETSLEVATAHGFKANSEPRTGIYNFADIDDDFISIHHWMKWYKFGITRSFDNLSLEIRNSRISREQAIKILKRLGEDQPEADIRKFCIFTGISKKHFYEICESFRNLSIWKKKDGLWIIPDFLLSDWRWK